MVNNISYVETWYEPTEMLRKKEGFIAEMTEQNHAFISGIIKMKKPKKIVEIGVAEGGTTALIMQSLGMLSLNAEVYSVDINESFYYDKRLKTGYAYETLMEGTDVCGSTHQFLFGKTIAGQIELIGGDIDCVIIDTTHRLPGELLDFLIVAPYLAPNAIVILHDVDCFYGRIRAGLENGEFDIATRMLFGNVAAHRYIDKDTFFSNIAAFEMTQDTMKYIDGCFYNLGLPWKYALNIEDLRDYRKIISMKYDKGILEIFDMVVNANFNMFGHLQKGNDFLELRNPVKGKKIAIYGAGKVGKIMHSNLSEKGYEIIWVDQNAEQMEDMSICNPIELLKNDFECIVIAVASKAVFNEIYDYIITNKLNKGKVIYGPILIG